MQDFNQFNFDFEIPLDIALYLHCIILDIAKSFAIFK